MKKPSQNLYVVSKSDQEKMELTWTHPQTRQRNTSQKSEEIHVREKVK